MGDYIIEDILLDYDIDSLKKISHLVNEADYTMMIKDLLNLRDQKQSTKLYSYLGLIDLDESMIISILLMMPNNDIELFLNGMNSKTRYKAFTENQKQYMKKLISIWRSDVKVNLSSIN